ncbi:putative ribonuclease H-like domain-containing protein [Tanacetum coccineum]
MTHPSPKRNMVPKAVLMKSDLVSLTTARPVNTAQPRTTVNSARPMTNVFNKAHSTVRRPKAAVNVARPKTVVNTVQGNQVNVVKASACWVWKLKTKIQVTDGLGPQKKLILISDVQGNPHQDLHDKGVIDSGCSRHMTSYLTNFEEIDRGYVSFGGNPKGGKITSKGTIKTGNLDFEDVYFVRELKFNLFSVSQMRDKKNSVLFNDTECIVLSPNFKLTNESHVLLKVLRMNNMYSVDLKNIILKGGLTCIFAKAIFNESKLWHRRLRHINFKTMNKLAKGKLICGIPSKLFENDQTCVACQKGKQHRASSTKDVTSGILKSFITGLENLIDQSIRNKSLQPADPLLSQSPKSSPDDGFKPSEDNEKKVTGEPRKEGGDSSNDQEKEDDNVNNTNNVNTASDGNSTNNINAVSSTINAAGIEVNVVGTKTSIELPDDPNMPK